MTRTFNGTADTVGITGGPATYSAWVGLTIAAVVNRRVATGIDAIWATNAAAATSDMKWDTNASGIPRFLAAGGTPVQATTAVTTGWEFDSITKATGTATPRRHQIKLVGGTWLHQNYGGTMVNNGTAYTDEKVGDSYLASSFFDGDIAWVGVWNEDMSDAQVEAMAFQHPKRLIRPSSVRMFILNQDATTQLIRDLCQSGAVESSKTGTAIGGTPPSYPAAA